MNKLLHSVSKDIQPVNYNISFDSKRIILKINNNKLHDKIILFNKRYDTMWETVDKLDKKLYEKIDYSLNYYKKFSQFLEQEYDTVHFSKGGIKLYEILKTYHLIKNKSSLETYHLCELPGSFVYATDIFLKNETKVKSWKWTVQSLIRSNALENTYNLSKKYKKSVNYGETKNGNVTKIKNITYYSKKLKNADIITSDCGTGDEKRNSFFYVTFASILTTICGCKKGHILFRKYIFLEIKQLYH